MRTTLYICFLLYFPLATAQSGDDEPSTLSEVNNDNFERGYNPSITIILVVMVAAFFLMGFFTIYTRHCTDAPSNNIRIQGVEIRPRKVPRGLDRAFIDTFPILEYSEVKIHKIGKEALECAICLCEFEDSDTLRLIPKCDHVFHPECIDEWLSSHSTCPVCRANLVPQPGESVHALPIQTNVDSVHDIEAQNDVVSTEHERVLSSTNPELVNRCNRPRRFPRSHSTGHSLVQPVENTERFTLRLPLEVRKRIINRQLQRASSFILLPNRTDCEGSSRGRISKLLNLSFKQDRWVFTMQPPFLTRALSPSRLAVNNTTEGASNPLTQQPSLGTPLPAIQLPRLPV
ncbi:putative transcription factor C2H2 family [Lupinus albus]|uniref:RING-type E3 ubiquitin transferase n=1 Tax=Lupinus albus TaxID=3870 RepID=A0A6A4PE22_LUPAL|nr:putative transcription factor C2H2 family [Lupinus albus]